MHNFDEIALCAVGLPLEIILFLERVQDGSRLKHDALPGHALAPPHHLPLHLRPHLYLVRQVQGSISFE